MEVNIKDMFKNLKIKHKIILMPLIAAFTFFLIIVIMLILNERNKTLSQKIQTDYYPLSALSQDLEENFAAIQRGLQDAVATADTAELVSADTLSNRLLKRLDDGNNLFKHEDTMFMLLKTDFNKYYPLARKVSQRMITQETSEEIIADLELMIQKYNRIKELFSTNTQSYKAKTADAFELTHTNYRLSLIVIITTTLSGIFLLGWISIVLTNSINRPLTDVVNVANEVGSGNFSVKIKASNNDEIGILKETFRTMIGKINQLIGEKDKAFNELLIAKKLEENNAKKLSKLNQELISEIDERKKVEAELSKHRDHLEELVEERTNKLKTSNKNLKQEINIRKQAEEKKAQLFTELESVNQELKDFAYVVSHDLKAPLRAIGSLSDWLVSDYQDKLDEEGQELVTLLNSRVKRMHNLIEGILQYSRVGRIQEKKVDVNLNQTVPDIIDLISPPENINIKIENCLPNIHFEKTRMDQIFQNLLSNAIKYMDKPEGMININCVAENGNWQFSVADNGPGIEEKHYEKIFQIFQTLNARDEFESTGVGLTLVKKIIETNSGKIWVESQIGKGSTFYFNLPRQEIELS